MKDEDIKALFDKIFEVIDAIEEDTGETYIEDHEWMWITKILED